MRREQVRETIEHDPESVVDLVMALQERVEELERRLGQDSRNSSKPPSSDPPKSRAERRREAREKAKEWSKRKPGGQPGHEGKTREMVGAERVDEVCLHLPERCRCGHAFEGSEERVGEPVAHQEWELPPAPPTRHRAPPRPPRVGLLGVSWRCVVSQLAYREARFGNQK